MGRAARATCAAITYDRAQTRRTPWPQWDKVHSRDSAPATGDRLRGYFWANLLTRGHLRRLGGLDALRATAAAHGLTLEALPSPQAAILRAPGPITAFDDEQLAAMKQMLAPALIPARYLLYERYPLRIIPAPDTAFRRVPPGSRHPRLLPPEPNVEA